MLADFFSSSFEQIEGLSVGNRKSGGLFGIIKVRVFNHSESSNNPLIKAYELFISIGWIFAIKIVSIRI